MSEYHIPVLLTESISALVTNPDGIYADATFGGGGHTASLLSRLNDGGRVIAFDRDIDAIARAPKDPRLTLIHNNFRFIENYARHEGVVFDGILADLGVSSHQFDTAERGFSFRFEEAPLDMRMNQEAKLTAEEVVNTYSEADLERILRLWGEVDVYQALRIEVNQEMRSLEKFLEGAARSLKPEGRLVVITYHSLDDRMVKNFIKTGNVDGIEQKDLYGNVQTPLEAVNRKPILPDETEIAGNTRARSAKLRIAKRRSLK